jgi:hypothetical protein
LYERLSVSTIKKHPGNRAKRGNKERFEKAMGKVADVEPDERDKR